MRKKLFLMLALFTGAVMGTWAETGTETEANQTGGGKNTSAVGTSYTIDGIYIAGGGSAQASPMTSKGLKLRTAQNGATLEFTVNTDYTITKLVIAGVGNYAKKDAEVDKFIDVTKVEVDGTETAFAGGKFPAKGASAAATLTIDNIAAKQKIVLYFDNSNAGGTQINASWEVAWSKGEAVGHTHNYASEWSSDANGHWHACTAEGTCDAPKADSTAHTYGTADAALYTCTVCGYVDAEKKAAAEAKADSLAIDAVITKIAAIDSVTYTAECKAKIDEARKAYDALAKDLQAKVTNYETLTDAEAKYAELKEAAGNADYKVAVKKDTDDAENWVITPSEAKPGTTVTFKYKGAKQIKSIKVVKK